MAALLARDARRDVEPRFVVADDERRRPAFWRVFWRVISLVSPVPLVVGSSGETGGMGITVGAGEGCWLGLEFLRMPMSSSVSQLIETGSYPG